MTSVVEQFVSEPSVDLLEGLNKEQLYEIAEHYEIALTSKDKKLKKTVFNVIQEQLVKKGVIKLETAVDAEAKLALRECEVELKEREWVKQLALKEMELKKLQLELDVKQAGAASFSGANPASAAASGEAPLQLSPPFDVAKNIRLVPPFSDKELDKYFAHFERVATTLRWPENVWTLLLQCVLTGKAQEVFTALSPDQCGRYHIVKNAIVNAYQLVPEA